MLCDLFGIDWFWNCSTVQDPRRSLSVRKKREKILLKGWETSFCIRSALRSAAQPSARRDTCTGAEGSSVLFAILFLFCFKTQRDGKPESALTVGFRCVASSGPARNFVFRSLRGEKKKRRDSESDSAESVLIYNYGDDVVFRSRFDVSGLEHSPARRSVVQWHRRNSSRRREGEEKSQRSLKTGRNSYFSSFRLDLGPLSLGSEDTTFCSVARSLARWLALSILYIVRFPVASTIFRPAHNNPHGQVTIHYLHRRLRSYRALSPQSLHDL